ncbi:MAG: nucleotide sugar dehydrogenase [Woeseiaceae bacterium]
MSTLSKDSGNQDLLNESNWIPSGDISVGIVGQGIVGAMTARIVSAAGIPVVGYDRDPNRIAELQGDAETEPNWTISPDINALVATDVIVVAVRVPANAEGPDLTSIKQVCDAIAGFSKRNRLVILETTLPPGATRQLADNHLNVDLNSHLQLAYCPERLREGGEKSEILDTPRLVGGLTAAATHSACLFLSRVGVETVPVSKPEVAELSKLLENTFLTSGISLMGEITRLSHAIGISATEVARAAATKPDGYFPFRPGPGIGGHCLINDLQLLSNASATRNIQSPLIEALSNSCRQLSPSVIDFLENMMARKGQTLSGSRVWVIGVGFKVGSASTSSTPATEIIRRLRAKGTCVVYSDSMVDSFEVDQIPVEKIESGTWPNDISAALLLAGDRCIDLLKLRERIPVVVDAGGAAIMPGSSDGITQL